MVMVNQLVAIGPDMPAADCIPSKTKALPMRIPGQEEVSASQAEDDCADQGDQEIGPDRAIFDCPTETAPLLISLGGTTQTTLWQVFAMFASIPCQPEEQ